MRTFTDTRTADTADQLWLTEHPPVFTQGLAGKPEHLLAPGDIPVVASDRGGQITYHGPGQLVVYCLLDLHRAGLNIRPLVTALEQTAVELLRHYGVSARSRPDAPGVYVAQAKIASLGLRVRRGRCYHGLSLNVSNDLTPFRRINPCGYPGLAMTRLADLVSAPDLGLDHLGGRFAALFAARLGYDLAATITGLPADTLQDREHGAADR